MSPRLRAASLLLVLAAVVAPAPALAAPPLPDTLRLYVLDCGRIRLPTVTDFGLADTDTEVRTLAVPCYLIEHPEGRLLWDAGLPASFAGGEWIEADGAEHRLDATLPEQLAGLGLVPEDVDLLAFSHFHYDHAGQANAFAGATLLIQEAEHAVAFGDDPGVAFFVPELYDALADGPTERLDGEHDVFGDGRVVLIPAPGHTPGHQVLYLELEETGPLVLSGDLYHFAASRALRAVPLFNTDADATRASMDRIEALLVERDAAFWIQHELARFETLRTAPDWYE
ncbi:MAG: N-acyl homoserine lactonase family protein [Pseudomonadales bacterium]|jgi:glyoxylase-like metal-dependent hydrolase (beta-lactamase superfamily II)|nr:N-acyl homoserine lactonase family protein [Pseudomonadales bacterium]